MRETVDYYLRKPARRHALWETAEVVMKRLTVLFLGVLLAYIVLYYFRTDLQRFASQFIRESLLPWIEQGLK